MAVLRTSRNGSRHNTDAPASPALFMVGCKDMTEEQLIYETEQLLTPLADRDCKECKGEKKVTAAKASLLVPKYRDLQTQEELAGLVECPYCRGSGKYITVKHYTTGEVGLMADWVKYVTGRVGSVVGR